MTDKCLSQLADRYGPQLTSISLLQCINLTAVGLGHLFEKCPNLEKFIIANSCLTDGTLEQLAANSRQLSTLYLSTCWKITDKGIMALAPGQITPILKTQEGYRIFKLVSKEPAGQRELNDPKVQQTIRETLINRKDQLLKAAYYEVARNDAKVLNYFASRVVGGDAAAAKK